MRCDLCGPYTPDEAAAIVRGTWEQPPATGYFCDSCFKSIRLASQSLADAIDARLVDEVAPEQEG